MNWRHVALAGVVGVVLWLMSWQAPVVTLIILAVLAWLALRAMQAMAGIEKGDDE